MEGHGMALLSDTTNSVGLKKFTWVLLEPYVICSEINH